MTNAHSNFVYNLISAVSVYPATNLNPTTWEARWRSLDSCQRKNIYPAGLAAAAETPRCGSLRHHHCRPIKIVFNGSAGRLILLTMVEQADISIEQPKIDSACRQAAAADKCLLQMYIDRRHLPIVTRASSFPDHRLTPERFCCISVDNISSVFLVMFLLML